jgi:hypothetical protein
LQVHLGVIQEEAVLGADGPVHEPECPPDDVQLIGPQQRPRGVTDLLRHLLSLLSPCFLGHCGLRGVNIVHLRPVNGTLAQVDELNAGGLLDRARGRQHAPP